MGLLLPHCTCAHGAVRDAHARIPYYARRHTHSCIRNAPSLHAPSARSRSARMRDPMRRLLFQRRGVGRGTERGVVRGTVAHRGDRATRDVANNMLRELARYSRYQAARSRGDRNGSYRRRVRDRLGFERRARGTQQKERERRAKGGRDRARERSPRRCAPIDRGRAARLRALTEALPVHVSVLSDVRIMGFRWPREIGIRRMLLRPVV